MAVDKSAELLDVAAAVLLVPCDPLPRGCGAEIGYECVSTSRNPFQAGKPLGRQVAHFGRLLRAGVVDPNSEAAEANRCRQTALPVNDCDHCARWSELVQTRPHRVARPVVAAFSGSCSHCSRPWPRGTPIVRVVGGNWAHAACSVDPPDDEDD